jgi:hypothetical protein
MEWGRVSETELMPRLVVGNAELAGSKLKNFMGFLKPNFELGPNWGAAGPHACEGKFIVQPSIRITGHRKGWCRGGAVITAVVAADLNWMIVCFQRKRTFYCSRSVSAIGPFTPLKSHSSPAKTAAWAGRKHHITAIFEQRFRPQYGGRRNNAPSPLCWLTPNTLLAKINHTPRALL